MNRVLLVAVVIALAVGAWLLFRREKPTAPAQSGSADTTTSSTDPSTPSSPSSVPHLPTVSDTAKPIPPAGSANEYTVGDVQIRDHRSGSNAKMDVPPNVHRPNTRELPSSLTADVAQKIRGVLADCAKDLPKEARGDHPRLEGTVFVAIKDHKLTVTSAAYQLRDVSGDAVDATKSCIEQKSVGLETTASDQDDIDNYSIGVTFAVM